MWPTAYELGSGAQVGNGSAVGFTNMTLRNSASRHIAAPDWQTRYQIAGLGPWPSIIVQPGAAVRPHARARAVVHRRDVVLRRHKKKTCQRAASPGFQCCWALPAGSLDSCSEQWRCCRSGSPSGA